MNDSSALERAFTLHRRGRVDEALAAYDDFLSRWPGHAEALHLSGLALYAKDRPSDAASRIERSLQADSDRVEAWCNLAFVYQALGRRTAAVTALREALRRDDRQPEIWNNLAGVLLENGDAVDAEQAARRALVLEPRHVASGYNLALSFEAQGRFKDALAVASRLVDAAPENVAAAGLKAQIEAALGQFDDAKATLAKGIAGQSGRPAAAPLYYQRTSLEEREGDLSAAARSCEQTLRLEPRHGAALSDLLFMRKRQADWHDLDDLRARFRAGIAAGQAHLSPFCLLSDPSTRAMQRRCAELWSARFEGAAPPSTRNVIWGAKLRIGYLSADFHQHATAMLAAGLFEQHDRARFDVAAYSTGPDDGSATRARLVRAFDRFIDAGAWNPRRLAAQIHSDRIDVLIDLKGYTHGAATAALALRPAPIQVSYLGYPGTTGAPFIDYLIGDSVVTPFAHAHDYSETLVQLPASYQVNDRSRPIAEPPSRKSLGLPEDRIVFCGFTSAFKLNPQVFDAWQRILESVPGAVLWLLAGNEDALRDTVRANIEREAAARGIDPSRLIFAARRANAEYLGLFRRADIFLDTWPYNAHTTASDALWAGCPVLTWLGDTFAARVAASLLHAVGLPELVTADERSYVDRAIELAGDRSLLARYRHHLEGPARASLLFDTAAATLALEEAYVRMVDQLRRGVREPIRIESDAR
jgi:protein O-GlcNAc transferase